MPAALGTRTAVRSSFPANMHVCYYLDVTGENAVVSRAAELLRTLGTTHRLSIILELDRGPRCVHELVEHLGASQSLVSQHLRVLRNSGLVTGARRGKETVYSLTDDHVAHIARDALSHGSEPNLTSARDQATSRAVREAHEW